MALPSSGTITAAMINKELGRAENAPFNLNDSAVRALAGKPSGAISFSDFWGKSSAIVYNVPANGFKLGSWFEYIADNIPCSDPVFNAAKIEATSDIGDPSILYIYMTSPNPSYSGSMGAKKVTFSFGDGTTYNIDVLPRVYGGRLLQFDGFNSDDQFLQHKISQNKAKAMTISLAL